MGNLRHAILGLPKSGKTTFLAALWHVLDAGEIDARLKLKRLVGNHKYLNTIVEAWRCCNEVPRTSAAAEETVSIYVENEQSGSEIVLSFPDLSGETFERQFEYRTCSEEYLNGFETDGGVLLFLNADRELEGLNIVDIPLDIDAADSANTAPQPHSPEEEQMTPWSVKAVPEQVQLVDLLQMLQEKPFLRKKRRLAVVVSAWDVITDATLSPDGWLKRERPLLSQYLDHNSASFEVKVYGLSAQGGGLSDENKTRLLALTPSERIKCVAPTVTSHDITLPLIWLSEAV